MHWQRLAAELAADTHFKPLVWGEAAALGELFDRLGNPIVDPACAPTRKGWVFLVHFGLLYRRGQGEVDSLCIPAGSGLRAQVLRECHDGPLGGHFGFAKTGSLVRVCRLASASALWVTQ
jgi:hypothetical protein